MDFPTRGRRTVDLDKKGIVYFAIAPTKEGTVVKVGFSNMKNIAARVKCLRSRYKLNFQYLTHVFGTLQIEQNIHEKLRKMGLHYKHAYFVKNKIIKTGEIHYWNTRSFLLVLYYLKRIQENSGYQSHKPIVTLFKNNERLYWLFNSRNCVPIRSATGIASSNSLVEL